MADNGSNETKGFRRLLFGDVRNITMALLLVLSLAVGGTLAYISARSNLANNVLTSVAAPLPVIVENGNDITESNTSDITFNDGTADKSIQVKNNGSEGYLRVRLTLPQQVVGAGNEKTYVAYSMDTDAYGFIDPSEWTEEADGSFTATVGGYTLTFDKDFNENWVYQNGWFYYRKVFPAYNASSNITEPLLVSVSDNTDENHTVEIGVIAETLENDVEIANSTWQAAYDTETGTWLQPSEDGI